MLQTERIGTFATSNGEEADRLASSSTGCARYGPRLLLVPFRRWGQKSGILRGKSKQNELTY